MSLAKIYPCPSIIDSKQLEVICDNGHHVVLTPDDVLTLKLLRDTYMKELHGSYGKSIRDWERLLQTLERILKQIQ